MAQNTKLEPAELKYPNGGGLEIIRATKTNIKSAEVQLMEARHHLEKLQLKQKHAGQSKPSTPKTKSK